MYSDIDIPASAARDLSFRWMETGFGGDPVTLYLFSWVSRAFGPVLVLRGKMPKFPNTFMGTGGKGLETMTDWESRYWSLVICEAPPSGLSNDGLTDMQVPLDEDGNYTIVVCREEDRPKNATEDNGVAWMDWSARGEGIDDPSNRADFGMLVFRYMYNDPEWKHNPTNITVPGTEPDVMGPYYPRGEYTDKATFEARGTQEVKTPPLTKNEKAANGPLPGDHSLVEAERRGAASVASAGYYPSLAGAEISGSERSGCFPSTSFTRTRRTLSVDSGA